MNVKETTRNVFVHHEFLVAIMSVEKCGYEQYTLCSIPTAHSRPIPVQNSLITNEQKGNT